MSRNALLLVGLSLGIGLVVAGPVGLLLGPQHWAFAGVGFGLCVPPGLVTLLVAEYLIRTSPFGRVVAMVVGTFVRLAVGVGGGVVAFLLLAPGGEADRLAFWLWLLFAYLTTLVVEMGLLAGGRRRVSPGGS